MDSNEKGYLLVETRLDLLIELLLRIALYITAGGAAEVDDLLPHKKGNEQQQEK